MTAVRKHDLLLWFSGLLSFNCKEIFISKEPLNVDFIPEDSVLT